MESLRENNKKIVRKYNGKIPKKLRQNLSKMDKIFKKLELIMDKIRMCKFYRKLLEILYLIYRKL